MRRVASAPFTALPAAGASRAFSMQPLQGSGQDVLHGEPARPAGVQEKRIKNRCGRPSRCVSHQLWRGCAGGHCCRGSRMP